jgi:hypothetical protein
MGAIHIYRQRNCIHHEHIQIHGPENSPLHQEYDREPALYSETETGTQTHCEGHTDLHAPTATRQNGRQFAKRYQEHKTALKNNNLNYSFAKHLNKTAHSFSSMKEVMQILQCHKKGAHLNTIERYHIYTEAKANNHLNDDHTIFPNAIFDTLSKHKLLIG